MDRPRWSNRGMSTSLTTVAPSGTPRGGVVVVQEAFGVTDHIVDICQVEQLRTAVYNPEAAADAWTKTLEWFNGHVAH